MGGDSIKKEKRTFIVDIKRYKNKIEILFEIIFKQLIDFTPRLSNGALMGRLNVDKNLW